MGTPFPTATAATFPINPAGRIPFYDPNASTTKYYASSQQIAATFSSVVFTLSSAGITSDATNGLAYGVSAPAGSTGQEAAINTALAAAYTASGGIGLFVIWDVAVALGAPVYIPGSFTTIWCPNKACGAILRASANCPILRAPGTNLNMTVAQNTQNTFGQYDSGAPGGSHNYRVFNQSYVAAQRLEICGGTWNSNYPQNGQQSNATYGFNSTFQLWGIDGLKLLDLDMLLGNCYHIHILNCRNIEYDRILVDAVTSIEGNDGIHFNGPCTGIKGGHARIHCGDDNIALNADDGSNTGSLVAGVNFQCGGDITDVIIEGPDIWVGTENEVAVGAVRLLSTYHRIDNVTIKHTRGQTSQLSFKIGAYASVLCAGNGNVGRVLVDDYTGDNNATGGAGQGDANILLGLNGTNSSIEFLQIRSRYRYNATAYPDIYVATNCTVQKLVIEWDGYQPAGASNNTQPVVLVAGTVGEIKITGSSTCDSSISTRASPFLRTATGASIARAILNVDGDFITNLVDHAAGTLTALIFAGGSHTNAGGGSPVAIASGLTIANLLYGNLVFKTGTAPFSGSGFATVSSATNLSYSGP
jgi:hypothetical protein